MSSTAIPKFRWFWLGFGHLVFGILGGIRKRGRDRVPRRGGLLVVANHLSDCDPPVVQLACPRHVFFMAKHDLFEMRFVGLFLRYWGAFPVRRGEPDRQALKHAIELLKAGYAVGIFPEGQLSEDGRLQPILPGVALIARQTGVPVICCGLVGTQHVLPYAKLVPQFAWGKEVSASWGEPRQFEKSAETAEIVAWIESELRALIREPKP